MLNEIENHKNCRYNFRYLHSYLLTIVHGNMDHLLDVYAHMLNLIYLISDH